MHLLLLLAVGDLHGVDGEGHGGNSASPPVLVGEDNDELVANRSQLRIK